MVRKFWVDTKLIIILDADEYLTNYHSFLIHKDNTTLFSVPTWWNDSLSRRRANVWITVGSQINMNSIYSDIGCLSQVSDLYESTRFILVKFWSEEMLNFHYLPLHRYYRNRAKRKTLSYLYKWKRSLTFKGRSFM